MEPWLREEELDWRPGAPSAAVRRSRSRSRSRWSGRRSRRLVAGAWALVATVGAVVAVAAAHGGAPATGSREALFDGRIAGLVASLNHQHRLLDAIEHCESRGEAGVVSPDGRYGGLFQFDQRTWAAMGGSGSPADASPIEQRVLAQRLLELRGVAPWPRCGPAAAARAG